MSKIFDCVIIGSGPAGLAAGNILSEVGIDFIIIEKGDYLYKRRRDRETDIVTGIGGCGLYSDGKISFYPSGSNLYRLQPELLKKSYQKVFDIFENMSIEIPKFETSWLQNNIDFNNGHTIQKKYQSKILNQDELYSLGFYLYDQIDKEKILIKHNTTKVEYDKNIFKITTLNLQDQNLSHFKSRNILFCGGKFGANIYPQFMSENDLVFKKFEIGFRFETQFKKFDYLDLNQTDLKLIFKNGQKNNFEFRTFCFCRRGYTIKGNFEGIKTFNGISVKNNDKTNFGLNLRIKNEKFYNRFKENLDQLKNSGEVIEQPIRDFLNTPKPILPKEIAELYKECLLNNFPKLSNSDANIIGPSFEYFGYYPELNDELKIENQNIWVAGDATGEFRGLIPALVSGSIIANSLIEKERKDKDKLYGLVRLKPSPTLKTKTIFTAQSKKFFYAKDIVCEFVFNEGCIPINPFQVFGYFLNDRVDREAVRNGNNELITRCDELWVFGPISDGVLFEIARAYELKIPLRFFTIGSLINEIDEITNMSKLVFEPEVYAHIGKENLIRFISNYYVEDDSGLVQLKLGFDDVD